MFFGARFQLIILLAVLFAHHLSWHQMAPKQSKHSSVASSSRGYADSNAGAPPPEDTDNDQATATLLQAMEDMDLDGVSKDDMLKVAVDLKSMKKRWSEIEKEKKK